MNFDLKILNLRWINNEDDPTDLCVHGQVFVKIGNEVIANEDSMDIAVSSTALYLMRTIKDDYKKEDYASQLLPCCGHFFMADEDNTHVSIMGCGNGIDWEIVHTPDNKVRHISDSGQEVTIDIEDYKKLVLDFADQVEQFYKDSKRKIIPDDDFDKRGYLTFWKEWRMLRNEWG